MKVLLLAAGRSKRAKPIEDKNFLKFAGRELIRHQLDMLKNAQLGQIIIAAGEHNIDRISKIANEYSAQVVKQDNLDEGMAGAVLASADLIKDEPLMVMSSNDVLAQSALDAMKTASDSNADAYLLAYEVDKYFPGGYLKIEGDRITNIVEKPGEGNEPSKYVNVVLHMFKDPSKLVAALQENGSEKDDRYEVALDKLMKELNFQSVHYNGYWQPIKYPWHVLDLMEFSFKMMGKKRIDPSAEIADSAVIKGDVVIEAGVKVFDNAVISGPAYIGKNSIVANNALVRQSMIGENCVVGFSTEVARSFIGDDCWFHSNYVGDTVMGNNCSFGAGAICANLRLDEKEIKSASVQTDRNKLGPILGDDIRVGVQTSLMPGVRIGSNTMITSGLVIAQDIDPNKFVTGKYELEIKENTAALNSASRNEMLTKLKN